MNTPWLVIRKTNRETGEAKYAKVLDSERNVVFKKILLEKARFIVRAANAFHTTEERFVSTPQVGD
jgi:hypothetical protein